jgi:uncharacterized protein YpbB
MTFLKECVSIIWLFLYKFETIVLKLDRVYSHSLLTLQIRLSKHNTLKRCANKYYSSWTEFIDS